MSDIDVFTIDDDFDPLAEIEIDAPSAEEQYVADYMPPIPDADKSIVPKPVALTAAERIDKLLAGCFPIGSLLEQRGTHVAVFQRFDTVVYLGYLRFFCLEKTVRLQQVENGRYEKVVVVASAKYTGISR